MPYTNSPFAPSAVAPMAYNHARNGPMTTPVTPLRVFAELVSDMLKDDTAGHSAYLRTQAEIRLNDSARLAAEYGSAQLELLSVPGGRLCFRVMVENHCIGVIRFTGVDAYEIAYHGQGHTQQEQFCRAVFRAIEISRQGQ